MSDMDRYDWGLVILFFFWFICYEFTKAITFLVLSGLSFLILVLRFFYFRGIEKFREDMGLEPEENSYLVADDTKPEMPIVTPDFFEMMEENEWK